MNKKRYKWWGYIKAIVREYPKKHPSELSGVELREYEAVKKAVDATRMMQNGVARIKVIGLMHWSGTRTLEGAAFAASCDRATAARWQRRFFEEVAKNRDMLN